MVKHNNVIPNQHFHKKWAGGANGHSRGPLHVVTWFDQAAKKKIRRMKRAAKAAALAPRPTGGALKPVVHCPTIKYNSKTRLGRGFSKDELKGAGIPLKFAKTIGIAVDLRRVNKSVETMQGNIERLKEYKSKLVLFPRKRHSKQLAKGPIPDSPADVTNSVQQHEGIVMPLPGKTPLKCPNMKITAEMKNTCVHSVLRIARTDAKLVGIREEMLKKKKEDEAKKKK
jgi:large subunit ribosomal protein L13e